jgi:hypothetical protein
MDLDDRMWTTLMRRIDDGSCTPVIGAGASAAVVPAAAKLAEEMATEFGYPLADRFDLARVSQFVAINESDAMEPKDFIRRKMREIGDVDLWQTPYPYLAQLPFPLYITTNYDDLISQALDQDKAPAVDYCRWNNFEEASGETPPGREHKPSRLAPLVYHLHGHVNWPASMVLTEEDYLDFLITSSESAHQQSPFLRSDILRALAGSSLLFIGYRLSDWTFRLLFRGLQGSIGATLSRPSISIQLLPDDVDPDMLAEAQEYLQKYFGQLHRVKFTLYWGDATEFARTLLDKWQEYKRGAA